MTQVSLEAKNVSRAFGSLKAVDDVSLMLEAGQIMALLGPSGSGKSTLLRILAGLEGLDRGEVFADGQQVASPQQTLPPEKRGLGMVFQDYALFPHLNALHNVMFGLQDMAKSEARATAHKWLSSVGLADRETYFPHQLSGGEQQRVALARALAPNPTAILMDEPFSGLDPHLRGGLQRLMLFDLRRTGVAALIVSHDTEEALAMADAVAIMDQGRIIQSGPTRAVYERPVSLKAARAVGPVWTEMCRGKDGYAKTRFGIFPTDLTGDALLVARPENTLVTAHPEGQLTVTEVNGLGPYVNMILQGQDCIVHAFMKAQPDLAVGARANASVALEHAFIFDDLDSPDRVHS